MRSKKIKTESFWLMSEKGLKPINYDIRFVAETNQFCIDSNDELVKHAISTLHLTGDYWFSVLELIKEVEKKFEEFNKSVSKEKSKPIKVILYTLDMDKNSEHFENISNGGQESEIIPHIRFGYRVVNKMVCGDVTESYTIEDGEGNLLPTYDRKNDELEIEYSVRAEQVFYNIRENIINTCKKLEDFFGEDEQVLLDNISNYKLITE